MGARSAIRGADQPRLAPGAAGELSFWTRDPERRTLAGDRTIQRHGHAHHRAASALDAKAGGAAGAGWLGGRPRVAGGPGGANRSEPPRAFPGGTDLLGNSGVLRRVRDFCLAQPGRRIRPGISGSDGVRQAGNRGPARGRARGDSGWRNRLPGAARRPDPAGDKPGNAAGRPRPCERDGRAREAAGGARVPLQRLREIIEKDPPRTMRILNVTETYAPFLEFGGPPVKVRALSEGLARRGHQVTVVTADWGLEKRVETQEEKITAERSPFGWRRNENGVQAIYIPTWLRYRSVSWNPAVKRYCRARLQNGVEVPASWPTRGTFRRAHGISPEEKLILFLGRLSAKKSPDLLLRAFAELTSRSTGIPVTLVFAGPDENGEKAKLSELASQ